MADSTPPDPPMVEGEEAPPRGVKAMAAVRWALLALAALFAAVSWWTLARAQPSDAATAAQVTYHCPMHPQIVSSQPGECPICHMTLEPMTSSRAAPQPSTSTSGSATANTYTPRPAPLAPSPGQREASAAAPPVVPGSTPRGTTPIALALDRVQAIGVRTAVAAEKELTSKLRVTATVAPTEQGVAEVHVRAPGFVEQLFVDQTGVRVRGGQPLFAFYSPELYQAESELLAAKQWADAGARTFEQARRKLELLGMAASDVDRVIEKGEPSRAIHVYAPQGGYIAKKNVVRGSYVAPETVLYEIQDLSRVYIVADVFGTDLARVRAGDEGTFTPSSRPGLRLPAHVDLVYPTLDVEARTTRVRMQIENASHALRPGEYGVVELAPAPRKVLVVPRDAVIDTGEATYVFVDEGAGRFAPRVVALAGEEGESAIVGDGVHAGDRVVSGATFLVDSESRLQASMAASGNSQ